MQCVGVDARRVDKAARLIAATVGVDLPTTLRKRMQSGYGCVELKPDAVFGGVFGQRIGQPERADDAAGGCPERSDGGVRDVRFHFCQLGALDDTQPLDAVGNAVFIEFFQRGAVIVAQADDKAAALLVGEIQFFGEGGHPAAALDVQACHQAAVGGVVPGVDDGAVGLRRAAADVLLLFQNQNIGVIARPSPSRRSSARPCSSP